MTTSPLPTARERKKKMLPSFHYSGAPGMGLRSCVGQRFHCRVAQIVMHKKFSWIKAFAVPGCNEGSWSTSYWLSSWLQEPPFAFSSGSSNRCWPPKDFSIHFATGIASIWMTPFFFFSANGVKGGLRGSLLEFLCRPPQLFLATEFCTTANKELFPPVT